MYLIFWFVCLIRFLSAGQLELEVHARSAILMNAETGAVLYQKHAHIPAFPASTTKISTALFVLDRGMDLNQDATVTRECLKGRPPSGADKLHPYWLDSDGTTMSLKLGEVVSLDVLLHGLMLISGNDAANVIAEKVGGTVPQFMERLNEYLQDIGCKNTRFVNPHGLPHPDHVTTAYDLALMTRKALRIPKFRSIVSTLKFTKPKTNKQPPSEITLTNPLLKPNSRYYYPKAIGVKSGYTAASQFNLVAAAEEDGRTLIAVLLGCENKGERYEDAKRLFEVAFAEKKTARRLIGPENVFAKSVDGAKTPLKASVARPVVHVFFPSEEPSCKAALHWNTAALPIRKGQKVGEVHILDEGGELLQKGDLVALNEVKGTLWGLLRQKAAQLFR